MKEVMCEYIVLVWVEETLYKSLEADNVDDQLDAKILVD
jgi:hypothetical protein